MFHKAWCRLEAIEKVRVCIEQLVQLGNRTHIHRLLLLPLELLLLNLQLVDNKTGRDGIGLLDAASKTSLSSSWFLRVELHIAEVIIDRGGFVAVLAIAVGPLPTARHRKLQVLRQATADPSGGL